MKKVGILTFHRAANYGAVLQAYALYKKIRQLGFDCELIDYRNPVFERIYAPIQIRNSRNIKQIISAVAFGKMRNQKLEGFRNFIYQHCVTSPEISTDTSFDAIRDKYDVVIVGSDQVWNLNLTGGDYHFFLDFVTETEKRCSYAASIATNGYDDAQVKRILAELQKFSAISVRENSGKEYLKHIGVQQPIEIVLDPTLLLDEREWMEIVREISLPEIPKPYLLAYFVSPDQNNYNVAIETADRLGLKAVLINYSHRKVEGFTNIRTATPEQFVGLFHGAEFVVTNSFHGTAFSINLGIDFIYMLNKEKKEKNERIDTLIGALGLECRNSDLTLVRHVENWDEVHSQLNNMREKSLEFLKNKILN